jgi:polysaccharide export outer membrane protein
MELRQILADGYARYVNEAEVSLIIREIHSLKVSVVGMVKLPGRYELQSQATVLEALALAGGLTEFAKRNQISVFRRDGQRWQFLGFDYTGVVEGNGERNFVLRPGDIVVVP